jgi:hypothetical protein
MILNEILKKIEEHMKQEGIDRQNAAINIPCASKPTGKLVEMTDMNTLNYLLESNIGSIEYKEVFPAIETDRGFKECTYVVMAY